jgi:uncharacterized membrane protein required for colicin V production
MTGFTWVDWAAVALVALFALGGFLRGMIAQVFVLLGLIGGAWTAGWTFNWLGHHWAHAEPAIIYMVLRWVVACLAGMVVASASQWIGTLLSLPPKPGPIGVADRVLGVPVGAAMGIAVTALLLLTALAVPWPREVRQAVAGAHTTAAWMRGGERVCRLVGSRFPNSIWLAEQFRKASGMHRTVVV